MGPFLGASWLHPEHWALDGTSLLMAFHLLSFLCEQRRGDAHQRCHLLVGALMHLVGSWCCGHGGQRHGAVRLLSWDSSPRGPSFPLLVAWRTLAGPGPGPHSVKTRGSKPWVALALPSTRWRRVMTWWDWNLGWFGRNPSWSGWWGAGASAAARGEPSGPPGVDCGLL